MPLKYNDFYHPFGVGSSIMNFKPKIDELKNKYFEKISKDILVSCIYNKNKERYTFFFKIPSEGNDKYPSAIMYDVVLEFEGKSPKTDVNASDIRNYDIRIFSNSPGYVFTFSYVIKHKYNALAKCIPANLLSMVALKKAPEIKNQVQLMTIEKTTWWALFHLDHNGFLIKETIGTILSKENEYHFIKKIMSQPAKLKEINDQKNVIREEKLQEKSKKNITSAKKSYSSIPVANRDPLVYNFEVANKKKSPGLFTKKLFDNKLKSANGKNILNYKKK